MVIADNSLVFLWSNRFRDKTWNILWFWLQQTKHIFPWVFQTKVIVTSLIHLPHSKLAAKLQTMISNTIFSMETGSFRYFIEEYVMVMIEETSSIIR